ncbi:Neuropeptide Y receptor type 1 [Trichoplax sp. H2]|nr:Neuropeptide Y receptor type 1 [Trichoplax sp. H2]|eukprot:RDD35927.1 Neuropeptide Y receptor type 1 [Trichoplax sp. H2]
MAGLNFTSNLELVNSSEMLNDTCLNCTALPNRNLRVQMYTASVISLIGIGLNFVICYAIIKKKLLNSSIYAFIFNISISDIITLFGLILNTFISNVRQGEVTMLHHIVCKCTTFILSMSFTVSILCLAALAIDRYYIMLDNQIYKPSLKGNRRIKIVIVLIWIYAAATNSPQLHLLQVTADGTCDIYYYGDNYNLPYFVAVLILNFCLPVVVMIVTYRNIILRLKVTVVNSHLDSSASSYRDNFQVNRRRTISTIKMIVVASVVYMITSFPVPIIMVAAAAKKMTIAELRQSAHPVLSLLITVSLAASVLCCIQNPIIYLIFNSTLRGALPKWCRCYKCCSRYEDEGNTIIIQVSTQQQNFSSTKV